MEAGVSENGLTRAGVSFQPLKEETLRDLSPNALAFIGDAVFELYTRDRILREPKRGADEMNREKMRIVNAAAQARALNSIDPYLTDEERAIVRKGRNAKHHTMAKHQTVKDYTRATGLEALCGFLYLRGDFERLRALLKLAEDEGGDGTKQDH